LIGLNNGPEADVEPLGNVAAWSLVYLTSNDVKTPLTWLHSFLAHRFVTIGKRFSVRPFRTVPRCEELEPRLVPSLGDLLQTITDPNNSPGDNFGAAVAGVGTNVLAGASGFSGGGNSGAAYRYDASGKLLNTFTDPGNISGDFFGNSVAALGNNVLVGAYGVPGGARIGAVYLYDASGTILHTFADPGNQRDFFGISVAAVGNNVLIGASQAGVNGGGVAYLYSASGTLLHTFTDPGNTSGDNFGISVAAVGNNLLIGAHATPNGGSAYLYDASGTLLHTFPDPNNNFGDTFGTSVAGVGNHVLIGDDAANGFKGAAYLYDTSGTLLQIFTAPNATAFDHFGASVAGVGNNALVGAYNANGQRGAAYLFGPSGTLLHTFTDPNNSPKDFFGFSVAGVGTNVLVGAYGVGQSRGAAYLFDGTVSPPIHVVGADAGGGPAVVIHDAVTGSVMTAFNAFPASFTGGARVAVGDVNGDGVPEIAVGAGPGGGPQVTVFDGSTRQPIRSFYAFTPSFTGGVYVAVGDVNGDGYADIICGADKGGGPQVTVWSGKDGSLLASFYAFPATFSGGVRVAAGDVNGDGYADIICAAGPGGGPQVIIFDGKTFRPIRSFNAFPASFTGGVHVAAADLNGDGLADIVVGAGAGGGPQVSIFNGADGAVLASFLDPRFGANGVRVGTTLVNGKVEILVTAGGGTSSLVDVYDGPTLALLDEFFAFDPSFRGAAFVSV
jgi:hypothetical protein